VSWDGKSVFDFSTGTRGSHEIHSVALNILQKVPADVAAWATSPERQRLRLMLSMIAGFAPFRGLSSPTTSWFDKIEGVAQNTQEPQHRPIGPAIALKISTRSSCFQSVL
jgi:hypothetical protein